MISRAGYGLAGLLMLAAATGFVRAQSLPLTEQPVVLALKIDPWAIEPRAIEGAEPRATEARDTEAPKEEAATATAAEAEAAAKPDPDGPNPDKTDVADLELDWSQLDVDVSTLMINPASKARVASRNAATG